jgi:hypothetical protein
MEIIFNHHKKALHSSLKYISMGKRENLLTLRGSRVNEWVRGDREMLFKFYYLDFFQLVNLANTKYSTNFHSQQLNLIKMYRLFSHSHSVCCYLLPSQNIIRDFFGLSLSLSYSLTLCFCSAHSTCKIKSFCNPFLFGWQNAMILWQSWKKTTQIQFKCSCPLTPQQRANQRKTTKIHENFCWFLLS